MTQKSILLVLPCMVFTVRLATLNLFAQEEEDQIAATVEGEAIYVREVDREVAKVTKNREVAAGALKVLKAQALRQLVKRRLILRYLTRKKLGASEEDVTLAIARVKDQLKSQNLTLEAYLKSAN